MYFIFENKLGKKYLSFLHSISNLFFRYKLLNSCYTASYEINLTRKIIKFDILPNIKYLQIYFIHNFPEHIVCYDFNINI